MTSSINNILIQTNIYQLRWNQVDGKFIWNRFKAIIFVNTLLTMKTTLHHHSNMF